MSKVYVFLNDTPAARSTTVLPDVYCPVGGYDDQGMGRRFTSKGEKFRYLRSHGMREAELINPEHSLGGTEGCAIKRRGSRGNFHARPMPGWMRKELAQHVG